MQWTTKNPQIMYGFNNVSHTPWMGRQVNKKDKDL